jgi:G:T/U-mismatch repair DNA glycosylase
VVENQTIEFHPWKWFVPDKSKTLVIGTFPTAKRNWKYNFFYPNTSNLFWRVMAEVADTKLQHFLGEESVIERKKILEKIFVAVTDMGNKVIRNEDSSLDEKLIPLEYMNIFKILEENPGINKILLTSSSGKVNASKWFSQFLISKNVIHKIPKGKKPIKSEISFKGKTISLVVAYSTSPRAANRISFEKLVEMYKNELV